MFRVFLFQTFLVLCGVGARGVHGDLTVGRSPRVTGYHILLEDNNIASNDIVPYATTTTQRPPGLFLVLVDGIIHS